MAPIISLVIVGHIYISKFLINKHIPNVMHINFLHENRVNQSNKSGILIPHPGKL